MKSSSFQQASSTVWPFAVIVAATNGDEAAIQEILDFFDGYISKLSLRKLYDEYGNVYMVVDSELKGRIQAAVMDMIANFVNLWKSIIWVVDFHRLANTVGSSLTTE